MFYTNSKGDLIEGVALMANEENRFGIAFKDAYSMVGTSLDGREMMFEGTRLSFLTMYRLNPSELVFVVEDEDEDKWFLNMPSKDFKKVVEPALYFNDNGSIRRIVTKQYSKRAEGFVAVLTPQKAMSLMKDVDNLI